MALMRVLESDCLMFHKRIKGKKGEEIACKFLQRHGFDIVDRNYQKNWGELDIIAKKDNLIHFFEVKSVTKDFSDKFFDTHRPEDNVDGWKIKQLRKIITTYLDENGYGLDSEFKFHVLCVFMNVKTRKASVRWLKDVIL